MKTILVSGASGIVGYGILRSLMEGVQADLISDNDRDLLLIGTSIYNDSVAQGFCDVFEQAPMTNDPGYIDWLLGIIKRYKVDLIIPGIEADMYKWNECRKEIEKSGVIAMLNVPDLITLCHNKWFFYQALDRSAEARRYAIKTSIKSDYDYLSKELGLPFLVKPITGFASKGIAIIENIEQWASYERKVGQTLMAQEIVGNENEEYTVSAFCDGRGGFAASQTLQRKLSKDGYTDRAEVFHSEQIQEALKILCKEFCPVGATNFQFRIHEGHLKLLEINPRISSSTSIRTAFGYNESIMSVEYYLDGKLPQQPDIRSGKAIRYTEDYVFYD
jgi:carbamoyl-phosphate synthase large subunit